MYFWINFFSLLVLIALCSFLLAFSVLGLIASILLVIGIRRVSFYVKIATTKREFNLIFIYFQEQPNKIIFMMITILIDSFNHYLNFLLVGISTWAIVVNVIFTVLQLFILVCIYSVYINLKIKNRFR